MPPTTLLPVPSPLAAALAEPAVAQHAEWENEGGALAHGPAAPATGPVTDEAEAGYWMTGTIRSLRPGRFGFIVSHAFGRPWALKFRATAVAHDGFDQLVVGQQVRFRQEAVPGNPSRAHAVRVGPIH